MRPILLWEKFRLIRYEQSVSKSFNALTIISEQDKHYIQNLGLKPIRVIPNGVDTKYFKSSEAVKKYDLLFTGNLSYPPNEDCVRYLSEEIMPFVWKLRPETNLLISGASPTESILRLGNSKINVQGWTEDIRMAYDSASIFVAPMRIGTGMQNKILEAMAMGLPCIASSLVGNGIGHLKGNEMILENDPMAFAQSIVRLIDSKAERERMSKLGVQFVKQYYTWESSVKDLETIFKDSNYSSFN